MTQWMFWWGYGIGLVVGIGGMAIGQWADRGRR